MITILDEKPDKVIVVGDVPGTISDEMTELTKGSKFIYEKELGLANSSRDSFGELAFMCHKYEVAHEKLLKEGHPILHQQMDAMNKVELYCL